MSRSSSRALAIPSGLASTPRPTLFVAIGSGVPGEPNAAERVLTVLRDKVLPGLHDKGFPIPACLVASDTQLEDMFASPQYDRETTVVLYPGNVPKGGSFRLTLRGFMPAPNDVPGRALWGAMISTRLERQSNLRGCAEQLRATFVINFAANLAQPGWLPWGRAPSPTRKRRKRERTRNRDLALTT